MAWARTIKPRKSYQGVATHPSGRKATRCFPTKTLALAWAEEQEATWRRDLEHDPRAGELRFSEWVEMWLKGRNVGGSTEVKNASHLKNHVRPQWDGWPLNTIGRLAVGEWIADMHARGVGAPTIQAVVALFSTVMQGAVDLGRIPANPGVKQRTPRLAASAPEYFTKAGVELILVEIPDPMWRVACDLDAHVGLRLGELLGLKVGAVDWERSEIFVGGVMTRRGWRAYGKSKRSRRTVPIPDHLLDALTPYVLGRDGDLPVFPAPGGGHLGDQNFRHRIWNPAIKMAGRCAEHRKPPAEEPCEACVVVPRYSPHTLRHTAASWLVSAGVDLHRIQVLLGHESYATTLRYSHLMPDSHERIRSVWRETVEPAPVKPRVDR